MFAKYEGTGRDVTESHPPAKTNSKSPAERAAYTRRRAIRTADAAVRHGARWSIGDALTAIDPTLTVPEAAVRLGRTAAAVEGLRAKWRAGQLSAALTDHLPPPPKP